MLFAFVCKDKPDHLQVRMDNRPAHLDYLRNLHAEGVLKFAGPFLDDDGKPDGSLVVIEADSKDDAARIGAEDPYAKAGLFETVTLRPWNWVFNNPANAGNP